MAAIELSDGVLRFSADKTYLYFTATATAADTIDFASVLAGRRIGSVIGANVTDGVNLTYTYTAAGVVTVPAGPSADEISVIIHFVE